MKVITVCGSLKFKEIMQEEAEKLALNGYCVLTPIFPFNKNLNINMKQLDSFKKAHFKRIELSDAIYVVNKDNYIGDSTKLEIDYATKLNKEIIYYE
jgi:hypothetical protein